MLLFIVVTVVFFLKVDSYCNDYPGYKDSPSYGPRAEINEGQTYIHSLSL